jgi:hypothetical protein
MAPCCHLEVIGKGIKTTEEEEENVKDANSSN